MANETGSASLQESDLASIYETMCVIRLFEEEVHRLATARTIRGLVHTYAGQEAVAVGVCAALKAGDYVASTHRGHGHCIAKGVDVKRIAAEMFGKATGLTKGKGGDMHMADLGVGFLGTTGVVSGSVPLAVGAALTSTVLKKDAVGVAFFGDSALAMGLVHESMNLAAVWKLPVLFVRENNKYGGATPEEYAISVRDPEAWARCYGLQAATVDGMDVLAVYDAAKALVDRARKDRTPAFIEAKTYRMHGTNTWDTNPTSYRSKEEEEAYRKRDPLQLFRDRMLKEKRLSAGQLDECKQRAAAKAAEAVQFAESSPLPGIEETYTDVYGDVVVSTGRNR